MVKIFGRAKPKNYEMPQGQTASLDTLRIVAGIPGMDLHLRKFDVGVKFGSPPVDYTITSTYSSLLGGSFEFRTSDPQYVDEVMDALSGLIPHSKDKEEDQKEDYVSKGKVNSGGKIIAEVKPKQSVMKLHDMVEAARSYASKGLRDAVVTGYKLENIPPDLQKKIAQAGLPMAEVHS